MLEALTCQLGAIEALDVRFGETAVIIGSGLAALTFIQLLRLKGAGHVAGVAVLMGLCSPGDLVLELGRDGDGHREGGKLASSPLVPLEIEYLPFDQTSYNVDVVGTIQLIDRRQPRMVILGSSNFLFPHPVSAIAEALKAYPDTLLVYDASHVMGFLAAGRFQDPLREGADLVIGSTHKTLPGPQGGIIFSNRSDLMDAVSQATYPALVTNHHTCWIEF